MLISITTRLRITFLLLTATAMILPLTIAQPALASESTTCGAGQTATTQNGFSICATVNSPGSITTPMTQPPGNGHPGSLPSTTITYTTPSGCTSKWYSGSSAVGQSLHGSTVIATCQGTNAASNLNYYGSFNKHGTTCTVIGSINGVLVCSVVITYSPGTPPIPPPQSPIPTTQTGIPTQLLAVFDSLNVPTPKIAGMLPDPTNSDGSGNPPYLYTNLPTQVAVVPSSLPPTLTSSNSTSTVSTVNTTWNPQLNKWNTKQVTTTLTATITATLQGYYWAPEAGTVNGEPNVAVPNGETQGNSPGSVVCPPSQNSLDPTLNNNLPNGNFCFIDFTQPSTKSGYYIRVYGEYAGQGTITENGSPVWSGPLGYRWSNVPASVQAQVASVESVNCATAACVHAGLAPLEYNWVPYGPETP